MNNKYSLPKDGGLIEVSAPRDIIHRYEKIHTTVYENEYLGVQYVADTIVKAIRTYNEIHCSNEVYEESQPFVLGLTTGRTPLGLYRELVKRHEEGIVSFRNVAVFSLDEFYPIRSTEQQSRNFRIHEDFLNHIDNLLDDFGFLLAPRHQDDLLGAHDRVDTHRDGHLRRVFQAEERA